MVEQLILGSLGDASWESLNPENRVMFLTSLKVSFTLVAMLCWHVSLEVYEHPALQYSFGYNPVNPHVFCILSICSEVISNFLPMVIIFCVLSYKNGAVLWIADFAILVHCHIELIYLCASECVMNSSSQPYVIALHLVYWIPTVLSIALV